MLGNAHECARGLSMEEGLRKVLEEADVNENTIQILLEDHIITLRTFFLLKDEHFTRLLS